MSWAIWITGLPGSGKSVLAREAAVRLHALGESVTVLELDRIREILTPTPSYSDRERELVYRTLAHIAATFVAAGLPVIVDATAHRRAWRDVARALIPRFAEVQLRCPLAVCRRREAERTAGYAPSGIYARAGEPGARVPGVDVAYELALAPELSLDTGTVSPSAATAEIVALARRLAASATAGRARPKAGCVIWITGRPGSGKTTLARGVAEALATDEVVAAVLDLSAFRRALRSPDAVMTEPIEEMAHRAVICTAKLLSDAGVTVLVDAASPRRAWRELARRTILPFSEVQLVCPTEITIERELASRWCPGRWSSGSAASEIDTEYEESSTAELTLRTHEVGEWSAVDQVVRLVRRRFHGHRPQAENLERRPDMRVRELMTGAPITVSPQTPVFEARQRMLKERIRHLIVLDGNDLVGIVTDRDIRLNLPSQATSLSVWEVNYLLARLTVDKVMSKTVLTVGPDRRAREAARIMLEHKIGALPVVDGGRVIGILTETDILRAFVRSREMVETLRP